MVSNVTPPSRRRRPRRVSGDEREQAILTTLEGLLETRRWHEVSIDEIARGAGISRPTFYFYFESKEAVLLALVARMVAEAEARPAADDLRERLAAFYDVFRSHRAVTLAGADARATSAGIRAVWSQMQDRWAAEAAAAIEAERARGAAPPGAPARDLAVALLLMNERVFHASLAGQTPAVPEDRVVDVIVAVWLGAIYGSAAPSPA